MVYSKQNATYKSVDLQVAARKRSSVLWRASFSGPWDATYVAIAWSRATAKRRSLSAWACTGHISALWNAANAT
ncbi:Uncharacterised protein [Mycobacteroides abscessus subsp. abscessus]|nr:Uncharacterised protein [Mycobacteroides abscessus subsp. abscessus]